jgi:predicted metal-dependent HD superfamily phosphohydrolase
VTELAARWSERQRVWHGPSHLLALLAQFEAEPDTNHREILQLATAYHDAIYNPLRSDNEEASAQLLLRHAADPANPTVQRAAALVEASRWTVAPTDPLTWRFWEADCRPLASELPLHERLHQMNRMTVLILPITAQAPGDEAQDVAG